jgi:predicted transport protein
VTLKTSFWRVDGVRPTPVLTSPMDLEERLEDFIVADPDLLGPDQLLVIDRQVATSHGKLLDILAIDDEARLHAVELKKDKTPRDVVAQALDYGWWLRSLTLHDAREIWLGRQIETNVGAGTLDAAYEQRFQLSLDEETFNNEHRLTIVAASLDTGTPRILEYLSEDYAVPINAVLFSHFIDDSREYLSRTWLRPPSEAETKPTPKRPHRGQHKTWNGRDIFMPLGRAEDDPAHARWNHCLTYGFVGAGGGAPYWKFLRNLEPGMRVFGFVGGAGYIAIGEVTGSMVPLAELTVEINGEPQLFLDLPACPPLFRERALGSDPDMSEYAVPVEWSATRDLPNAVWESGLHATPLPGRLKDTRTIEHVEGALGLSATSNGFSDISAADRLAQASDIVRELFEAVEQLCSQHGLQRSDLKWWINFIDGSGRPIIGVVVRKSGLRLYTDHDLGLLRAARLQVRDVSNVGHHGSGRTEITLEHIDEVAALDGVLAASNS